MNKNEIDEFIQLLQEYELSIALLYETFASILPNSQKSWMDFAQEERLHAKWVNQLHAQLSHENISFEQTKLTVQSTKTAIVYLRNKTEQIKKERPDLLQALHIAVSIEKSLLEGAFLKIFKLHGKKAQLIQARLRGATEKHIDRLIAWQNTLLGRE